MTPLARPWPARAAVTHSLQRHAASPAPRAPPAHAQTPHQRRASRVLTRLGRMQAVRRARRGPPAHVRTRRPSRAQPASGVLATPRPASLALRGRNVPTQRERPSAALLRRTRVRGRRHALHARSALSQRGTALPVSPVPLARTVPMPTIPLQGDAPQGRTPLAARRYAPPARLAWRARAGTRATRHPATWVPSPSVARLLAMPARLASSAQTPAPARHSVCPRRGLVRGAMLRAGPGRDVAPV